MIGSRHIHKYNRSNSILLSIVFLNFNRVAETRETVQCLRSIIGGREDIEIVAVDNGSEDGTRQYLEQQTDVILISLRENKGIQGYNKGFSRARGKYLLVLDDDSSPRDLKGIELAMSLLDSRPEIGLVAFHIENPDRTPQWSWHLPELSVAGRSPFFIGCGFMIRRRLFAAIGWYPADFFLYQNEIDVAFKLKQRHFELYYHPDCRIIHRGRPGNRPGWRRIFFPTRNTLLLIRTYYHGATAGYMIFSRLVIGFVRSLYFRKPIAFFRAATEGLLKPVRKTPLSQRTRQTCAPFFNQNSLWHHLVGMK